MKYFSFYPTLNYQFPGNSPVTVTNIFIRQVINVVDDSGYNITGNDYIVEDGKSPDAIARDAYQNPDLFWYILTVNKIYDFYKQWPVSYDIWIKELDKINSKYTFFFSFNIKFEKGDIISKYRPTANYPFDKDNYAVVIGSDSYMRSVDVDIVEGDIKDGDNIIIIRGNGGNSYSIISTPTGLLGHTLQKKELKLESAVGFMMPDKNTKENVYVSPYSNYGLTGAISEQTDDITGTECLLDLYIRNILPDKVTVLEYKTDAEKEWIFKKVVNIIPKNYAGQIKTVYLNNLTQQ
jgi:hypothetical protein